MKKLTMFFVPVLLLAISTRSQAQATVTFGPEVGFSASGLYDNADDVWAGVQGQVGGVAHIQLGGYFAVRPSLQVQFGKYTDVDYDDYKISLTRISLPVPLLFSKHFDNDNKLYFGAGPNLKFGLAGKMKDDYEGTDIKIKFGNGDDQLKPLEIGAHAKAGFDFGGGASLGMFFNFGLNNLSNYSGDKFKTVDAIGFTFAWMFGGNSGY